MAAEEATCDAALEALHPLMEKTGSADMVELGAAIQRSREARALRSAITEIEMTIKAAGDGKALEELLADLEGVDPDSLAARTQTLDVELGELNEEVAAAASAMATPRGCSQAWRCKKWTRRAGRRKPSRRGRNSGCSPSSTF